MAVTLGIVSGCLANILLSMVTLRVSSSIKGSRSFPYEEMVYANGAAVNLVCGPIVHAMACRSLAMAFSQAGDASMP